MNAGFVFAFDRPTAKHASYSVADFTAGGGLLSTALDRWSPLGDTLYITPFVPLPFGHDFGMKLNRLQGQDSVFYINPAYYQEVYYFSTLYPASVERVQPGNVNLSLTPDVTLPVPIPVREVAGTDVHFTSVRVQFLSSSVVADSGNVPLDLAVTPFYEYTAPVGIFLSRNGAATLVAPVTLPASVARTIPQGVLGVRLTFYGTDETSSSVVVDVSFRVDPASVAVHPGSVLPAIASDVLVRTAVLEWPLHGAVVAAGDTILPRAVVTGNGTGAFRAAFYMDGDVISIEEGYMEAGRPVEITMRGPLPTRRLGEHRLQFVVESPQPLAANPISFICAPPPNGVEPLKRGLFEPPAPPARAVPEKLHGSVTWLAEARSKFREEDRSAVGWGAWNGAYDLGPTKKIEAEASTRLRFDELGNGRAAPQHVMIRYSDPRRSLEYGDAPPDRAYETPLLMSPVPRRSAQAGWHGTPLGDLDGYVALSSNPVSAGGEVRNRGSDLYSARLRRSLLKNRVETTLYGGYTHEKTGSVPSPFGPSADSIAVRRAAIYGGMAKLHLPGMWTLLADGASVRHRAVPGAAPGRSRTGWRSELHGTLAGFDALAQDFSYQPELATALNPYALSDRRGGYAKLERSLWRWRFLGSFRSEEPAHTEGLEPVVRVQTGTFSGRLAMNEDSWVSPSLVHIRNKGANTDFTENRIATEYSASEPLGGRTTARFDVAFINDELRAGMKRRVTSGSLVTTRRHPGRVASTLALGFEQNRSSSLDLTDTTIQGAFEVRWEAIPGRFLVMPVLTGSSRDYELQGTREDRYSARLQLALLRVAGLGENAVSLEGRVDRVQHLTPSLPKNLDGSVQLTVGQRFRIGGL
ncbi:MAG TPA: hypothetical protein VN972_01750 [Methylomirabilota bacterium]|nr:hypothetical protein [Methylomirabilota bacterium]